MAKVGRKKGKLTPKQRKFAEKFVDKGSAMEAALESYNVKNNNSAAVTGHWALQQPQVQREIEKIMAERNMTDEDVMDKLAQGLSATIATDYKGEISETDVPDYKTRHKYLETAIDIKGLKAPKKTEERSISIDATVDMMSEEDLVVAIKEQLKILEQS